MITLIEIMIVMFLIALITGVLAYNYRGSLEEGRVFKTQAAMQKLETILEGGSLSTELKRSRLFPPMATRMMAVGEETGHLSQMLSKTADMYEDNLEKTIERVMSLIQPLILIVMGAIIGLVLLAILLPMTDISSLTTK